METGDPHIPAELNIKSPWDISNPKELVVDTTKLMVSTIKQPGIYRWQPKEDITAYELAQCMTMLLCREPWYYDLMYSQLPDRAKRHFEKEN